MSTSHEPVPSSGDAGSVAVKKERKKLRLFMWFMLAVQAVFALWIIAGLQSSDCAGDAACEVGTGLGVTIILITWFGGNAFLLVGYGLFKLARRP